MRSRVAFFRRVFSSPSTDGDPSSMPRGQIAYRVRVGVTGHRTITADPGSPLAERVRQALTRVREIAPASDSTDVRLAVVSPLAEGADRLVARVALEDPETILEVPLPVPVDDYATDFETDMSKRAFRELLNRATAVSVQPDALTREEAYERVGRLVVDSCDVVIALWDGRASRGRGGTAEIVRYTREQGVPLLWIETASPYALTEELRGGIPDEALRELDEYNSTRLGGVDLEASVAGRTATLLSAADAAKLPRHHVEPFCAWIYPHYVRADALADRAQAWYHRLGNIVLISAAGAVLAIAAQALFAPEHPELAVIEVALMAVALAVVALGRRQRSHGRWLAYRFLAERFRSALFLALAGVWGGREAPPEEIRLGRLGSTATHDKEERRDDWVRRAFLEVWTERPQPPSSETLAPALERFLGSAWIEDQASYHRSVSAKYEQRHVRLTRVSYVLFGATLVAAAVHAFAGLESHDSLSWSNMLVLLSIGLPAVAASVGAFHAQREYERNSERSRGMVRRLESVTRRLERATDLAGVRAAAWDIEQVMIDENDDWLVTMRFQDIKPRV